MRNESLIKKVLLEELPVRKALKILNKIKSVYIEANACSVCGRQYPDDPCATGWHDEKKHAEFNGGIR